MLKLRLEVLLLQIGVVNNAIERLNKDTLEYGQDIKIHDSHLQLAVGTSKTLYRIAEQWQMKRTLERLKRLDGFIEYRMPSFPLTMLITELREVIAATSLDFSDKLFLYVPELNAKYYDQDDFFGIKSQFPTANEEIKLACNCFATGNYTACVFHLMRAVEIATKAMVRAMKAQKYIGETYYDKAAKVKVFKRKPVELCDWKKLIDGLNKALSDIESGSSSSVKKKKSLAFYSHAIAQFSYFKDAWRNTISHGHEIAPRRKIYLEGETSDIMNSTRHFMRHLAARIKE